MTQPTIEQLYQMYRGALTAMLIRAGGDAIIQTDKPIPPGALYYKQVSPNSIAFWFMPTDPPADRAEARRREKLVQKYATDMASATLTVDETVS